jgi:hypothetical protein
MMSAKRIPMRNRFVLFSSAVIIFTVTVFLFEAHAGVHMRAPEHCGFWTTIDAGLSCQ